MTDAIEFLTLDDVLEIHAMQLARWGGSDGIRDRGALDAAIAQAQATFGGEPFHCSGTAHFARSSHVTASAS